MENILMQPVFQMSLLLFVALAGYLVASRINQSAVIGLILVGIVVGPSALGLDYLYRFRGRPRKSRGRNPALCHRSRIQDPGHCRHTERGYCSGRCDYSMDWGLSGYPLHSGSVPRVQSSSGQRSPRRASQLRQTSSGRWENSRQKQQKRLSGRQSLMMCSLCLLSR